MYLGVAREFRARLCHLGARNNVCEGQSLEYVRIYKIMCVNMSWSSKRVSSEALLSRYSHKRDNHVCHCKSLEYVQIYTIMIVNVFWSSKRVSSEALSSGYTR